MCHRGCQSSRTQCGPSARTRRRTSCHSLRIERRYSQTEKEALALVWACEKLHPYIYGIDYELVTDHKPLQAIFSPRSKPCTRIERWVLRMQPYAFKVVYAPGRQNITDPPSRLMADESPGQGNLGKLAEGYVRFVAMTATPSPLRKSRKHRKTTKSCLQSVSVSGVETGINVRTRSTVW